MPEDIGTKSCAATFEFLNKFVEISIIAYVYITYEFIIFQSLLVNFPGFQGINSYIRWFMTVVITLLMQFLIKMFCPVFTNNLLPYSPTNVEELMTLIFVVVIIVCFIMMVVSLLLTFSTNRCCHYTKRVLSTILCIYLKFCITCATFNVIFIMLKELK